MKVIFICTGNTCRSPMAEAIMKDVLKKKEIKDIEIYSYGLFVNPFDNITNEKAVVAVKKLGINMRVKKAKQLNSKAANSADYIITMTAKQKLSLPYPNVYSLDDLTGSGDMDDPYGGSQETYDATAFKLKLTIDNLVNKITEKKL